MTKKIDYKKAYENYKEAYFILCEYWDSFPDEEKPKIDERLRKLGL